MCHCEPGFTQSLSLCSPTNVVYHPSKAGAITNIHKIYTLDLVNYDKALHICLLLIVNICLLFVYAFLIAFSSYRQSTL